MKTLGIVGGLGPESTIDYYRSLIAVYRQKTGNVGYPRLVIVSLDVDEGLRMLGASELAQLTDYLAGAVRQLAAAGADFALISANSGHIVFHEVQRASPLPLISIVETACEKVRGSGLKTVGLLGTRFTTLPPGRQRACDAVVLDDAWMLDGQVGSSCVEILHRVSTCGHHLGDESIRGRDRAVRIVDEHALDPVPFTREGVRLLL